MNDVTRACPCGLPSRYVDCCGRFHGKTPREPATPEELMRSRFSAFATANVGWLYRSLHADHPDRARSRSAFRRDLERHFATGVRYTELEVVEAPRATSLTDGTVLFIAHGTVKGQSFLLAELSTFRHDGTGWRYREGQTIPEAAIGRPGARSQIADLRARGIVA